MLMHAGTSDRKQFNLDLCETLVHANIPIWKLENKFFKDFLEKYTGMTVPDESTIRKNYVDVHYNNTIAKIRNSVGNSKIWVSIDESTDTTGRQIANIIVGTLKVNEISKIYLLYLCSSNGKLILQIWLQLPFYIVDYRLNNCTKN